MFNAGVGINHQPNIPDLLNEDNVVKSFSAQAKRNLYNALDDWWATRNLSRTVTELFSHMEDVGKRLKVATSTLGDVSSTPFTISITPSRFTPSKGQPSTSRGNLWYWVPRFSNRSKRKSRQDKSHSCHSKSLSHVRDSQHWSSLRPICLSQKTLHWNTSWMRSSQSIPNLSTSSTSNRIAWSITTNARATMSQIQLWKLSSSCRRRCTAKHRIRPSSLPSSIILNTFNLTCNR